ncbi:Protein of unknown function [Bacillus cereus]
MQEKK